MMNQTLEQLSHMCLTVMEQEYRRQAELPAMSALSFEERFSILVDAEWMSRQNKKLKRLLKAANLRNPEACLEDVDFAPTRKLDRAAIARLSNLLWIKENQNLFILSFPFFYTKNSNRTTESIENKRFFEKGKTEAE